MSSSRAPPRPWRGRRPEPPAPVGAARASSSTTSRRRSGRWRAAWSDRRHRPHRRRHHRLLRARPRTKDLLASVLGSAGPTVAPVDSLNSEIGVPLTVCRVDRRTRASSSSRWAPGASATSPTSPTIAPPGRRRRPQRRRRPRRRVRLARRRSPQAKGELVEALPADGAGGPQRRRPRGARDGAPAPVRASSRSGRRPTPTSAPTTSRSTPRGRPSFTLVAPAGRAPGRPPALGERTTSATPWPSRPRRLECGLALETSPAALAAAAAGQPVADGGHRAPRRRHRRQRRLQRQPRLDARRPRGAASIGHGSGSRAHLGGPRRRCSSSVSESTAEHDAGRAAGRPSSASTGSSSSARPPRPWPTARAARRAPGTDEHRCRVAGRRRRVRRCCERAARRATSCCSSPAATPGCAGSATGSLAGTRCPREGVLIAGAVALIVALLGTPMFIRFLVKRGLRPVHPRRRPDVAPHQARHAHDGRRRHHRRRARRPTPLAHLVTLQLPTMSALLVLFLMTGLGLVGFLDDFIKISKQRSLGLRAGAEAGRPDRSSASSSRCWRCSSPTASSAPPPRPHISFVRDTHINLAFAGTIGRAVLFVIWANIMIAGTSNGVNLTDGLDGLADRRLDDGASRAYVLIGIWQPEPELPDQPAASSATRSATRSTSPSWPPPSWAPASGSCGGTPRRPRSSWATPGRWRWAARSPGWRSRTRTELLLVVLGGLFVLDHAVGDHPGRLVQADR